MATKKKSAAKKKKTGNLAKKTVKKGPKKPVTKQTGKKAAPKKNAPASRRKAVKKGASSSGKTAAKKKTAPKKTVPKKKPATKKKAAAKKKPVAKKAAPKKPAAKTPARTAKKKPAKKASGTKAAARKKTVSKKAASAKKSKAKDMTGPPPVRPAPVPRPDPRPGKGKPKKAKKLTAREMKKYRKALLELRDKVVDGINFLSGDNLNRSQRDSSGDLSGYSLHMADQGTDNYDREFALNLVSSEQDILYEIDEAIRRVDAGTYGLCEATGEPIERARLDVLPYARLSVVAQSEMEKGKKRYRPFGPTLTH